VILLALDPKQYIVKRFDVRQGIPPLLRKKRRKETYLDWWQRRIRTLSGFEDEAKRLFAETGVAYPVRGSWAVMKLALIAYYIGLYSSIIKSRFEKAYYVDFFAGPGLNRIEDTNDLILGSPLLADRGPRADRKFDKLILVENDEQRILALRKLLPSAHIVTNDINAEGVDEVLSTLPQNIPSLVFVDPEGLEIHWRTLERMLERWCDVMINFQSSGIGRTVASARNSTAYDATLDHFFGTQKWRDFQTEEDLLSLYVAQLGKHREVVIPIKVQGPGIFHYYIIVAVKKTKGTQGWVEAIHRAKTKIEAATSDDVKGLLDVYHKRQATLF
jgi:three-Cys-motif partner protein